MATIPNDGQSYNKNLSFSFSHCIMNLRFKIGIRLSPNERAYYLKNGGICLPIRAARILTCLTNIPIRAKKPAILPTMSTIP